METQFFIIEGGQQAGPFPKSSLQSRNLTPDTLVWYQGLSEWTPAGKVAELADLFMAPPAQPQYQQPQAPRYQYYYISGGNQMGPVAADQLSARGVTLDTMVWREGLPQWTVARNVPELLSYLQPQQGQFGGFQSGAAYAPGQTPYGQQYPKIHTNWHTLAIVATVVGALFSCIGMIFGIVAINKSSQANRYFAMGDELNGEVANNSAKTNVIIAFVLAGIGLIANIGILSTGLL